MSQCVPSWDLDGHPTLPLHSNFNSFLPDMLHYELAELTWENGQPSIHGLGPPRVHTKTTTTAADSSPTNYAWEKPRAGGTLESIVRQATSFSQGKTGAAEGGGNELVPWFDHRCRAAPSDTATMSMDALVPCSTTTQEEASAHLHSSTCVMDCSSAAANTLDDRLASATATAAVAAHGSSCWDNSVSGSAKLGRDSRQFTLDSCERQLSVGGFTSTSMGSPENNISGKEGTKVTATDDYDSVCHSRPQMEGGEEGDKKKLARKVSTPTKKRRAAAIHNQSERKRRDKINQRMKTLQKMIPNSSKTDKASMLDEVIEYLKQLKAQVQMMSTMSMPYMMMPMAFQQQLHQSSMMGIGTRMGTEMGAMDMNTIGHPNIAGIPTLLHPFPAFMPLPFWDGSGGDHLTASASEMPDPMSTFLACQPLQQPMTMEAYSRMAALYQQQQQQNQPPPSASKNP